LIIETDFLGFGCAERVVYITLCCAARRMSLKRTDRSLGRVLLMGVRSVTTAEEQSDVVHFVRHF